MIVKELFEAVEAAARSCERLSRGIIADAQDMDLESASEAAVELAYKVDDVEDLLFEIETIMSGKAFEDDDLTGDECSV